MRRFAAPAAVAALTVAAGCAGNGIDEEDGLPAGAVVVPSSRVVSEQYSGIEARTRRAIRTEGEWAAFWAEVYEGRSPPPARPDIDFGDEVVIVAAMGQRRTGGHAIEVDRVYQTPAGLVAEVVETSPAPDCVLSQAITAPVHAVRVPVTGRQVRFVERRRQRECE